MFDIAGIYTCEFRATINRKIFEGNSSFYVKLRTAEKVQFPSFKRFSLVLAKSSFWQGHWALGYHSMGFGQFPDIS